MSCRIDGIGVWGPGFSNWPILEAYIAGSGQYEDDQAPGPKPEIIPSNERRRAPLPVRLAVETSWQASQQAGIAPSALSCVFSSGFGDIDITHYMCTTLNTEAKQLSPTKFHNSVHNAPAGYWTISTGCMQPASSVAGFKESTPVTLLEAMAQLVTEQKPSLLTFCDGPAKGQLIPVLINDQPFAASLVLSPFNSDDEAKKGDTLLKVSVQQNVVEWPALKTSALQSLYTNNPSARILCLFEKLANLRDGSSSILMPLSTETSLLLELERG
ncbi:MAG: beta-ketoacyl synthase chain length factor [Acidiferrobacterales bacterium]|nr:beta-ketoacyl synthase chain length factor [Acidiferrobacterales bacterium]